MVLKLVGFDTLFEHSQSATYNACLLRVAAGGSEVHI